MTSLICKQQCSIVVAGPLKMHVKIHVRILGPRIAPEFCCHLPSENGEGAGKAGEGRVAAAPGALAQK